MGFLSNLFSGREIGRLEELLRVSPAPSLFVRLAQLHRENGDEAKAQEAMRRGAEQFPEHEALSQAVADQKKVKREAERKSLQDRLERFPSPVLYARLAELYLKDGEVEVAVEVCRTGCRAYPNYAGLTAVMGQIALVKNDLDQAVLCLERATAQDKYNYQAFVQLAEALSRKGDAGRAREALGKILEFAPGDETVLRKIKALETAPRSPAPVSAPAAPAAVPAPLPATAAPAEKKSSGVGTGLHLEIQQIRRVEGVRGTLLIDPYGLVIASDLPAGMDEDLAAGLIANIMRAIQEHDDQLTLGEFEDGIIDSDQGRIHLLSVSEMTMGVFATPETKPGLLQRAVHTFAERVLEKDAAG